LEQKHGFTPSLLGIALPIEKDRTRGVRMSHMAVYRTENNGGEPNTWKLEKVADIDWQEFSKQMLELHRIVDAGVMSEQQHQQVKEAITSILMDGLMPAFLELEYVCRTST
jgi:hypothetical protein